METVMVGGKDHDVQNLQIDQRPLAVTGIRFSAERWQEGMRYDEYVEFMLKIFQQNGAEAGTDYTAQQLRFAELNYQRTQRIQRTYTVSPPLAATIRAMAKLQRWLVLTEPWCGDSAQSLTYIAKFAEVNPQISLRIFLRDRNLDIMDRYLTAGKRGIPKLIAFAEAGVELFQWGPRPKDAAALYRDLQAQGMAKDAILEKLHLWYGRNRGQAIEAEFLALLSAV